MRRLAELGAELVFAADDELVAAWTPLPSAVRHLGRLPLAQVLSGCDALCTTVGRAPR